MHVTDQGWKSMKQLYDHGPIEKGRNEAQLFVSVDLVSIFMSLET